LCFRFGDVIAAMLAVSAASPAAIFVVVVVAAATASLSVGAGHVTELGVAEEQPVGTLVGSVRRDNPDVAGLQAADGELRFNFRFSSGPYELFSLDAVSGEVRTSGRVDREELCPSSSSRQCSLHLDVTVLPLKFYRILKVERVHSTCDKTSTHTLQGLADITLTFASRRRAA